jgi:hypothetical protein
MRWERWPWRVNSVFTLTLSVSYRLNPQAVPIVQWQRLGERRPSERPHAKQQCFEAWRVECFSKEEWVKSDRWGF